MSKPTRAQKQYQLSEEAASNKRSYNQRYYQANKDKILSQRKAQSEQPGWREANLQESRIRRARKSRTIEFNGEEVVCMRASELASFLGKSISTINQWTRHGVIPLTPYQTAGGFRLYTPEMAAAVSVALGEDQRPPRGEANKLHDMVLKAWRNLGVPV